MKQRITIDDLKRLNTNQMNNLRRIWTPARYQIAIAQVCVNAETDEYVDVEFSVGGVYVRPSGSVTLRDLRAFDGYQRYSENEEEILEPTSFPKAQCLPLLNVGEMIDIMDSLKFRNFHFYLLAGTGKAGCEVGNFKSTLKDKMLSDGFQSRDLCDVLWEMIVEQL